MSKHVKGESHHEHQAHVEHKEAPVQDQKILGLGLSTIALIAALVILTAILATWVGFGAGAMSAAKNEPVAVIDENLMKSNIESYFQANGETIFGSSSVKLTVVDINSANVVGGLYAVNFEISDGTQNQPGIFYANNEKVIVASMVFDLSKPLPKPETQEPVTTTPVKTDKPVVDLYVMSFCPYGNKAEDTMLPVYNLLKDKVTFNIHFIVNVNGSDVQSLHGAPEVVQNQREACVQKNYDLNKMINFMVYVNDNCGSNGSCWETAATNLGIDKAKINACVASEGVALMQANADASAAANASGSPTMIINGVNSTAVYQYGNSEAYKTAICDSFTTAPSVCSTVLSGDATATTQGGSC